MVTWYLYLQYLAIFAILSWSPVSCEFARKSDKIRQIVNEHTSAESQKTVESILDQVS